MGIRGSESPNSCSGEVQPHFPDTREVTSGAASAPWSWAPSSSCGYRDAHKDARIRASRHEVNLPQTPVETPS